MLQCRMDLFPILEFVAFIAPLLSSCAIASTAIWSNFGREPFHLDLFTLLRMLIVYSGIAILASIALIIVGAVLGSFLISGLEEYLGWLLISMFATPIVPIVLGVGFVTHYLVAVLLTAIRRFLHERS